MPEVKIILNNWIMYAGVPIILAPNWIRDKLLKQGYIKHIENSKNREMEFTEKYFNELKSKQK